MSPQSWLGDSPERAGEGLHDPDDGRTQDRDEQAREDAEDQWDENFHSNLLRLLFCPLPALDPDFMCLGSLRT